MNSEITEKQLADYVEKICIQLEINPIRPPINISPNQTAEVLHTSKATLSVWRSTGRYNLPYVKVSRRVLYPLEGVAMFLLERTYCHTGEAGRTNV